MSGTQSSGATAQTVLGAAQWQAVRSFALVGSGAIVAGGLVAAATGPSGFARGSWVAAYLVLVVGAAQVVLGAGQVLLTDSPPSSARRAWLLLAYNLANIMVLTGTLIGSVVVVTGGSVVLLAALVGFWASVGRSRRRWWHLALYRVLVAALALSVPIGVALSVLRLG